MCHNQSVLNFFKSEIFLKTYKNSIKIYFDKPIDFCLLFIQM